MPAKDGTDRAFEIRAQFYKNGNAVGEAVSARFNPSISDWQYSMAGIASEEAYVI